MFMVRRMYAHVFNICFSCRKEIKDAIPKYPHSDGSPIGEYTIHCKHCNYEVDSWHYGSFRSEMEEYEYKRDYPKTLVFLESFRKYKEKFSKFCR